MQTELLKSQFEIIAKKKAATFRNNCLSRADKHGIDRLNVPMPREIEEWLLTHQDRVETVRNRFYLRCEYTGELIKIADIQIDHRTPISRGGTFRIENLAVTSGKTNQHKGSLKESEFLELLQLLDSFEPVAKADVLTRLRRGVVIRKF